MRAVGNHFGARTISLALVAGLVAFEAVLVLSTGAVGIPGVLVVRFAGHEAGAETAPNLAASAGGESLFAKAPIPELTQPAPDKDAANPSSASSTATGEPRLDGLAEIPLKPWIEAKRENPNPEGTKAFGATAIKVDKEVLPWDAVEPYRPDGDGAVASSPETTASLPTPNAPAQPSAPSMLLALPLPSAVEGWVKAKASEIKGGERGRALYHFEFWLDAPEDVKRRLVAVAYDFNTPAVMPQSQVSREEKTGFRVSAGGLTCADKVTITLKFDDGQSQQVAVDGCRLVS
jgi:hypothetical protein